MARNTFTLALRSFPGLSRWKSSPAIGGAKYRQERVAKRRADRVYISGELREHRCQTQIQHERFGTRTLKRKPHGIDNRFEYPRAEAVAARLKASRPAVDDDE